MKVYLNKYTKQSNELLNDILLKDYQVNNYQIVKNQYGKKYLKDSDIFFNISHANDLIAIAIDDNECGIDLEMINNNRRFDSLVKHYFNDNEKELYINKANKIDYFYEVWTAKEAYSKMIGTGIVGYFNNLPDDYSRLIKRYNVYLNNQKYILAICTNNDNIEFIISDNINMEENYE